MANGTFGKRQIKKGHKARKADSASPAVNLIRGAAMAILFSALASFLFILAETFIAIRTPDPTALASPLGISALVFSSFLSGFLCSRFCRGIPLWCGAATAFLFNLLILITSLFVHSGAPISVGTKVLFLMLSTALTFVGAIAGNAKIVKKRRPRRGRR